MFNVKKKIQLLSIATFFLILNGCDEVASEDINSSGIYAEIEVISNGNGTTTVEAQFTTSSSFNSSDIELTGADSLFVTVDGINFTFNKNNGLLEHDTYVSTIPTDEAGKVLTVTLQRQGESALNSVVSLPEKFLVSMPSEFSSFSSGDILTSTWSLLTTSLSDGMEIEYDLQCVHAMGGLLSIPKNANVTDAGLYSVNVDALLAGANIDQSQICSAEITYTRFINGTLANYGKGGFIKAKYNRKVNNIAITP